MAAINDLISQISDVELRDRIQKEVNKLSKQKKFGLVFEEHLPECTPLYDMPIKVGCKVMLRDRSVDKSIYVVGKIENGEALCLRQDGSDPVTFALGDIVRVAEFGEAIYPYLKPLDSICNAPDSDLWHTLIEADNYHALQLLEYLYAGQVDCIYIDPPYNTGAKDWKYNNDYVDSNDAYRHSKWLSMMEKRLRLAKKLLNPKDSVLIVTIDEKEYLHLGCLLEEIFPSTDIQMISVMTNKKGSTRPGQFSRAGEYIFCVYIGNCTITQINDNMMLPIAEGDDEVKDRQSITIWNSLLRRGTAALRADRPNLFYPVYVDPDTRQIVYIGEPLAPTETRDQVIRPSCVPINAVACWPMRKNNIEGRWQMSHTTLKKRLEEHRIKAGEYNAKTEQFSIVALKDKQMEQIDQGILKIDGIDTTGAYIVSQCQSVQNQEQCPRTIWVRDRHDASIYGSTLLNGTLGDKRFSFPKSVYAVQDTLRFFVTNKPNALIVDFFAGSGTTLHAVNLLNAEDSGHRRCIMVTNNEVSDDEAKNLTKQGHHPGDDKWNELGVARYVTWPRTVCSIEGHDVNGNPLKGNYLGEYNGKELPMADGFKANAAFFQLGFLDKTAVALGMQFKEMLPTLWMKAGAVGPCPQLDGDNVPDMLILPQNQFAVLNNENVYAAFQEQVLAHPEIKTVFLVTDYEVNYRSMANGLEGRKTYQLYRDYLDSFRINCVRS